MTDKYFLDTNILVYSFDKKDEQKRLIAKQYVGYLLSADNYLLSCQVINEFCNVALRKITPPVSTKDLQEFIDFIPESRILPITKSMTVKALEIRERYNFSFWDSMVVSAAIIGGCNYLLTEDLSDSQQIGNLTVINPFRDYQNLGTE